LDLKKANRARPLVIGSVKTNIGHLEAAAGVAGLIKSVLSMKHNEIPKHLNYTTINPKIANDMKEINIDLPIAGPMNWPKDGKVSAINSFGFSGTNACLILKEWKGTKIEPVHSQGTNQTSPPPFGLNIRDFNSWFE